MVDLDADIDIAQENSTGSDAGSLGFNPWVHF